MSLETLLAILGVGAVGVCALVVGMIKWGVNRVVAEFDDLKADFEKDKKERLEMDQSVDRDLGDLWNSGYKLHDHVQALRWMGEKNNNWSFHAPWEILRRREKGL